MSLVLEGLLSFLSKFLNNMFSIFLKFCNLFNFNCRFSENVITKDKIFLTKRYSSCFNSFLAREILFLDMTFSKEKKRLPSNLKNFLSTLTTEDRLIAKISLALTSVKTQLISVIKKSYMYNTKELQRKYLMNFLQQLY